MMLDVTEPVDMRHAAFGVAVVGGPFAGARYHSELLPLYLDDNAAPIRHDAGAMGFADGYGYRHWTCPEAHAYVHASLWVQWRTGGER